MVKNIIIYIVCALACYGFYKAFNALFPKFQEWRKSKGYSDFWDFLLGSIIILGLGFCIYFIASFARW